MSTVYLSTSRSSDASRPAATGGGTRVPGTVFALGTVSLLTDISSEMITAFLPVYLLYGLHVSYAQFGFLDGLYTGATAVLRLAGGYLADRLQRLKAVAVAGYGLSAVSKVGFAVVGASTGGIGGLIALDRAGKGLRTAPRDAMISLATTPETQGRAFGVHRTMDTAGALLGPLVTFLLLAHIGHEYGVIFLVSACIALVGVAVLVAFVRDRKAHRAPARAAASMRGAVALLRQTDFRRITICASLLGLATISDAFFYVLLQQTSGTPSDMLPLLPLGTTLIFLLLAIPVGQLADRIGRWTTFLSGHVLLLCAYLLITSSLHGVVLVVTALFLHGVFYAATDGVLMAHASTLVSEELRASGLAVVQTGQALARFAASFGFGLLLMNVGIHTAVAIACGSLGLMLTVVMLIVRRGSVPRRAVR